LDKLTKKISNAVSSANMLGDENGLSDTDIATLIQSLEKTRLEEFAKTYETLNKVQVYGVF
jgi:biotin operon repressor